MAVIVLESLAVLLAAVVVVAGPGVKPADAATSRQQIVAVAQAEVGASEANGGCLRYGPCMGYPWCAVFVEWVWRTAGVSPVPTSHTATDLAQWGLDRGLFKPRPAGGVGDAQPGDLAVFGEPGSGTGGHVALVVSNNGDGTITTIGGNESNSVRRSTIYPATHRSGTRNVLISGYVAPPGLGSAPPGPPPLGNGSIIARNNGDGTYLEAVLAGWHAFPITQQDKAALGLGQAYVVPTDQFNLFLIAPVAEGTVLATKTAAGNWVEAVSAGGHAFPISQADKADLNLGDATKIPLRYFEGMAGGLISNGTIIAKKTSTGAWG